MYIGSTTAEPLSGILNYEYKTLNVVPGLIKIINEILDNSVDEFIRTHGNFANEISVDITDTGLEGWQIVVSDNGRGIPVVKHDDVYEAELGWTRARAGSNFSDDGRVTIGMNGVGSFATNCFSTDFCGVSGDGKTTVTVQCFNGADKTKTTAKKSKFKGTSVSFFPDLSLFGVLEISQDHLDVILDRITNLAICYPGIAFKFNKKKIVVKNLAQIAKAFHTNAISFSSDNTHGAFVIAPSGVDEEFRYVSYVNGLNLKNGGGHIDAIVNQITTELIPAIKRKWKIEVLPNQIKQHLLIGTWISDFPNPKFDSQSKERLTNTPGEIKAFIQFDASKIAKKILATDDIIKPMIDAILQKKEMADKRAAAAAMKKVQKKKIANHLPATDPDWTKRSLFIAEGLSAIGSLITVRDPKKHGGYALRGKIMNTHGMKAVDVVKNKELSELMHIIGLDLNSKDVSDLNYGQIVIMTDQDPDGHSIACLLLQFFSNWPDLFKNGRVARIDTPLYVARKKNKADRYFYTQKEFEAATDISGCQIDFMKGLGSLEKSDYKNVIDNPRLSVINWDGNELLDMAFGDSADERKKWMIN